VIDAELTAVDALLKKGQTAAQAYDARVQANYEAPKPRKPRGGAAAMIRLFTILHPVPATVKVDQIL
jgi:hypothetical protein